MLPLDGVVVLDLTRVLVGPFATMILADFGAEVIKIEIPGRGDDARAFGPFVEEESAYFMSINRNKKSITLNLKQEEGKAAFLRMIKKVDVVTENFRPGTMEKLGLGYDVLKEINPQLIYAASSGFGHTGPYSKRAAYDAIVQAMGGIMSITGEKGGQPVRVGTSLGDIVAGLYTTIGILTALNHRNNTGQGQKVDVAMLDCQVSILENAIARYFVTQEIPEPVGNKHPAIVPFETFATIDSEIMIAAGNDSLWQIFCKAIGLPQLAQDPRFCTNPLRNKNYDQLRPLLAQAIATRTTAKWQHILDGAGVPNGPINTVDQVVRDPQVVAREMILEVEHPTAGKQKIPGIPIKLSETPGSVRKPAPLLGEDSSTVLKSFGFTAAEIHELEKNDVL